VSLNKESFGKDFKWGISVSAYQIEGAHQEEGKGLSIWDIFTNKKGKIKGNQNGNIACNFYNRLDVDLVLLKSLEIPNFRFSLSWPRIMPTGKMPVNWKGVDFYNRKIDACLSLGIIPWVTVYHWDLPYELEMKGGWANRDVIGWFGEYTEFCAKQFGDRVNYWMVINEPMVFTGAGYFLGVHAPGKKGLKNFLPAMHHVTLSMGEGGRILKSVLPNAEIGTTFSCSHIDPYRQTDKDRKAAVRVDALLNRLFIEPVLGLGYPLKDIEALRRVEKYILPEDEKKMKYDFDFIGVQNYTREIIKHSYFTPYLYANMINPKQRNVPVTLMNWEVYPESIYHILKKYNNYPQIKKIVVTENGAAFPDVVVNNQVHDEERKAYIQNYLAQVLRAKQEGVKVEGYFIWTLMDNFEWAEGFHPRFGLVYVDFKSQQRIVKSSGHWYQQFLSGK
jgi:beta-glucosidase